MLRLVQISDTHLSAGHDAFNDNFERAADHIRQLNPDLIVHTGDVTRDAPGSPQELAFARSRLDGLETPVLAIPGNHDIGDNYSDGFTPASPVTTELTAAYEAHFGPGQWVEDRGGWRLVGVNGMLFGSGFEAEKRQWEWLADALGGHDRIALFLHKPLFLTPEHTPEDPPFRYVPVDARARLSAMIDRFSVRLVGCGHVHQTRSHRVGDTLFVWAPATAFILPDSMQPLIGDKVCGFIDYRLGDDGSVAFQVVQPDGIAHHDLATIRNAYPG